MKHDGTTEQQTDDSGQLDGSNEPQDIIGQQDSVSGQQTVNTGQYDGVNGVSEQELGTSEDTTETPQQCAVSSEQEPISDVSGQHTTLDEHNDSIVISEPIPISVEQPVLSRQQSTTSVTYSLDSKPVPVPGQLPEQYEPQFNTSEQLNVTPVQHLLTGQQIEATGQHIAEPRIVSFERNTATPALQASTSVQQFITIKSEQDLMSPSQYALTSNSGPQNTTSNQLMFSPAVHLVKPELAHQVPLEHHFVPPRQHVLSPRRHQLVATAHGPQLVIHGQHITSGQHIIPYVHGQQMSTSGQHVLLSDHSAPHFVTPGHNIITSMHNQSRSQIHSPQQMAYAQPAAMSPNMMGTNQQMGAAGRHAASPMQSLVSLTRAPQASPAQVLVHLNRTNQINDVEYMYSQYLRMLNR